ncbi:MAG: CRTAC1 family protein [Rhodothermales bacterium]|nr:CRTAC1 family protein [Rhodothermales bacterium]MBO6780078.1 CRTAC1 family protein [Rhodothermales bacterium]
MRLIPLVFALFLAACSSPDPVSVPDAYEIRLTNVSVEAGLGAFRHVNGAEGDMWFPETMGAGGGFVDLDQDGHLDVVLVAGAPWVGVSEAPLRVFRNAGDGTFARQQDWEPSGLAGYGMGIAAGDIDGDGDADLIYTSLGRDALLRNDEGVLVDVTASSGMPGEEAWSSAAAFLDADGDGHLDLYVARYVAWTPETDIYCSQDGQNKGYCTPELYPGVSGRFYRNAGDGTFEDRTEAAGFAGATGKTLGALVLDYNRDGHQDLMLANDTEPDELYLNQGDGTFREIGVISGIAFDERGRARAGMGVEAGVVDDTGEETVFVGNFSSEMIGVYRHMGNDVFLDRAAASRIGQPSLLTLTFGLALADLDLDGDLDLFAGNGHVQPHIETVKENVRFRQSPQIFRNRGDGTFEDLGFEVEGGWLARAVAWGDYDNDGDPDLLVTENDGAVHLLRNDSRSGASLTVSGVGVGSVVEVWTEGRRQLRFVRSGGSYLAQNQLDPVFGLDDAQTADSVVVRRPDGAVQRWADVAAGRLEAGS